MKKRKLSPLYHRVNGRICRFESVEDLKRAQIAVANQTAVAEQSLADIAEEAIVLAEERRLGLSIEIEDAPLVWNKPTPAVAEPPITATELPDSLDVQEEAP